MKQMTRTRDTLMPILGTLYPWRRRILYITAGAFILSIVFSLFMKDYYKGRTVFYAASQDLFKPEKVFGNASQEMFYYGSGEDIDRILTVGKSYEVVDFLIDSFDLWTVYGIKPGSSRARFNMRKAFNENYDILLTKEDALELSVEDTDPERAALLANAARDKIDFLVKSIIKNSQRSLAASYLIAIHNKEKQMQDNLDSLIYYRLKSGIYDPVEQTKFLAGRLTEITSTVERERATLKSLQGMNLSPKLRDSLQLIQARIVGFDRELSLLNNSDTSYKYSLPRFNVSKGKIELLESRYLRSYEQIGYDLEKIKLYNAAVEIDVSALHLITTAEAPLYKSRPKRSIIVLAVTAAAFLFSIVAVLFIESYRGTDWSGVTSPQD